MMEKYIWLIVFILVGIAFIETPVFHDGVTNRMSISEITVDTITHFYVLSTV